LRRPAAGEALPDASSLKYFLQTYKQGTDSLNLLFTFLTGEKSALVLSMLLTVGAFGSETDEAAIREVQARQAAAWNAHDAVAYASLFSEDGDVVNVLGWWWQGRSAIQSKLSEAFAWVFRDRKLTITDVHTRFLDPSTAIVHVRWSLDGAKVPPGAPAPPREGIQLQVLRKTAGRWLIASFQNTNVVAENPFPKGPPAASVKGGGGS
jgi:uncharacterized protein (TIGR02246 family)